MTDRDWDAHYASGDIPWDSDDPDPQLVAVVESATIATGRALDIGCGTGTHARWPAGRGFDVLGIDISRLAIEQASGLVLSFAVAAGAGAGLDRRLSSQWGAKASHRVRMIRAKRRSTWSVGC